MLAEVDEFLDETLTEIGATEMSHKRVDSVEYAEAFERKFRQQREQDQAAVNAANNFNFQIDPTS